MVLAPGEVVNPARHTDNPPRSQQGSRQNRPDRVAPLTRRALPVSCEASAEPLACEIPGVALLERARTRVERPEGPGADATGPRRRR